MSLKGKRKMFSVLCRKTAERSVKCKSSSMSSLYNPQCFCAWMSPLNIFDFPCKSLLHIPVFRPMCVFLAWAFLVQPQEAAAGWWGALVLYPVDLKSAIPDIWGMLDFSGIWWASGLYSSQNKRTIFWEFLGLLCNKRGGTHEGSLRNTCL